MPSLLLTVFFLQLAIHLINTIGAATINTLLWNLYTRLPTPMFKEVAEQNELKKQYLKLRRDLNATSSQDEFAKWAKLRRQHDKVLEQLEKSKSSTASTRTTFESTISTLRWLGTNGLRMFIQFWFQKAPMFYLPKGWVPYWAEWLLSFPRAPLGSVSVQAWGLACGAIILLVSDAIVAIIGLAMAAQAQGGKTQHKEKVAMPVPAGGEKAKGEKEL